MYNKLIFYIFILLFFFICYCSGSGRYHRINLGEGTSHQGQSSKGKEILVENSNKKILYITDNLFSSHVQFNQGLVTLLRENNYDVDLIVYSSAFGYNFNIECIKVNIERSPFINNVENEEEVMSYRNSPNYKVVGIYQEIVLNQKVQIGNEEHGILNYLLQQKYDIGISEFSEMFGPFAIFELLNIKNTFDVTSSILLPHYFAFFFADVEEISMIPALQYAKPGDWYRKGGVCNKNSKRYKSNLEQHENDIKNFQEAVDEVPAFYKQLFQMRNIKGFNIPDYINLFNNIKYHFINQHPLGTFNNFPDIPKLVYIGGFLVEDKGILTEEKKEVKVNEPPCVVFISFGTVNLTELFHILKVSRAIEQMFISFSLYQQCLFKLRIDEKDLGYLPERRPPNVKILKRKVKQQEILSKQNTKLFISHCGQNSLTEAMYAGVPLICIPFRGDQFYNSSIVEQKHIGIYVYKDEMFGKHFNDALNKILAKNQHQLAANEMRNEILNVKGIVAKNFLDKIAEV